MRTNYVSTPENYASEKTDRLDNSGEYPIVNFDKDFTKKESKKEGIGKTLEDLGSLALIAVVSTSAIAGTTIAIHRAQDLIDSRFSEEQFYDKANWKQTNNKDGSILDNYRKSGIPINDNNKFLYKTEVRKRNGCSRNQPDEDCLNGWIETPYFN